MSPMVACMRFLQMFCWYSSMKSTVQPVHQSVVRLRTQQRGRGTGREDRAPDQDHGQPQLEQEPRVRVRRARAVGGNKGWATGNLWEQNYTYDRYGNRTNVAANGVAADNSPIPIDGVPNLTYDNTTNRITTSGYHYDVNGNMIRSLAEDGFTWVKYEYDAANRLDIIKKDDAGQTQLERFQYDHTNARVQSHNPALDQYKSYLNSGGVTLAEFTEFVVGTPKWSKSYTHLGGAQLATITTDAGYTSEIVDFNHPDRLGTKTVTNQSAGTSSEQTQLPFGRPLDAESTMTANNKRFTSYDRSEHTKLDYAMNRTYDSKLGRFTQVDPIGMEAVSPFVPQTLNLYAYCVNDPVNYVDPSLGRYVNNEKQDFYNARFTVNSPTRHERGVARRLVGVANNYWTALKGCGWGQ